MEKLPNLAKFDRILVDDPNVLIVKGNLSPVLDGMDTYNHRHHIAAVAPETRAIIHRFLTAAGLAALSLSDRESWGWSITLPNTPFGFFIGVEPEGMLCVNIGEAIKGQPLIVVQRKKPSQSMTQSMFSPREMDPMRVVEQYFAEVEQTVTRLTMDDAGNAVLVHALPGNGGEVLSVMAPFEIGEIGADAMSRFEGKNVGEVLLFYECRCHEALIRDMVEKLPKDQKESLWVNDTFLEVECPRCGRAYHIDKEAEPVQ